MIRILIVDDHPLVRRGVASVLGGAIPGAVVEQAGDGAGALQAVHDAVFDLVILGLALPGRGGIDVLKELRSARPGLPVLILSAYREDQLAVRALPAGAAGYVVKGSLAEDFVSAVRTVLAGGKAIGASLRGATRL